MLQVLLNGLIQGSLFAVLGLAFSLVYATTRVVYVALGAIFTLAPYLVLEMMSHSIPWPAAVVGSLAGSAAVGVACEAIIHWPLERARASVDIQLVASLGAFLLIGQAIAIIWGNEPQVLRPGTDLVFEFGDMRFARGQLIQLGVCSACLGAAGLWLRRSETGLRFRALASNTVLMSVLGADVRRLRLQAFAMSGLLTALAALLTSFDVGFDTDLGMRAFLIAIAASIVGGRTSFGGAMVAGLMFGGLQAAVVWYLSARWVDAVTFAVLAAVLLFLPGGMGSMGRTTRLEEVE